MRHIGFALLLLLGCGPSPPAEPPAQPGTVAEGKATEGKIVKGQPADADKVLTLEVVLVENFQSQAAIVVNVKNPSATKLERFIAPGEVDQIAARCQAHWPVSAKDEHDNEYAPAFNLHPFFHGSTSRYQAGNTYQEIRPGEELHFECRISLPVAAAKTLTLRFPPLSTDKAEGEHVFQLPLQERDFTREDLPHRSFGATGAVLGIKSTEPLQKSTVRALYVSTNAADWFSRKAKPK